MAGGVGGVAIGYVAAKLFGQDYTWSDASVDFALGFATAGLGNLAKSGQISWKTALAADAGLNAVGTVSRNTLNGRQTTLSELALGAAFSGAAQLGGHVAGRIASRYSDDASDLLAGARCNSFVAGTEVLTPNGLVPIETIQAGDEVMAWSEELQELVPRRVLGTSSRTTGELLVLQVGDEVIETTPDHPFWVLGKGWLEAVQLSEGDELFSPTGALAAVARISLGYTPTTVHNLEVDDRHTFFVTASALLNHNANSNCQLHLFPDLVPRRSEASKRVARNKTIGDEARDRIAAREAPSMVEVSLTTLGGVRRVDVLKLGATVRTIESKVGRTTLGATGSRIRREIARDFWSLRRASGLPGRAKRVDEVVWEFSPSPVTGEVGPNAELREVLERLGFRVRINGETR